MKLLNLKEEIKEILEELENMYEISELEEQVNNINKIRDYIINLQQENKQLKGRVEYLERSCERKDESNIELYSENVDLASAIDEIKKYIDEYLLNERLVTYRDFRNGLLKIIKKVEK